ncbi:MAG: ERCC4 domain-containing protein [Anaerovoracaceae bacterium]
MQIQIDSREKSRAIKKIVAEFDRNDVKYFTSKLYVGDYINMERPLIIIDRKQNIAEIAQNATSGHKRLKKELQRLDEMGAKMYFLIEQDNIGGKPIEGLEDIMLWEPKFGEIIGERIYRVLKAWEYKHNVEFVFCNKKNTGNEIIRLLTLEAEYG